MSRADLVAACRAQVPHSPEWEAAVQTLGAARKAGFPEAKKPGRPTGRDYWQTIWQITKSHHFSEAERVAYRERAQWEHGSEVLYQEVTGLASSRAKVERELKKQATTAA